jgi:hypothetical protein
MSFEIFVVMGHGRGDDVFLRLLPEREERKGGERNSWRN